MKIIKAPNTNWTYKYVCGACTAELEVEKQDVTCTHYDGHGRERSYESWTSSCPICSTTINIDDEAIPKAVQIEIKRKSNSGGAFDR